MFLHGIRPEFGRGWTRDLLIAGWEDIANHSATGVHVEGSSRKKCVTTTSKEDAEATDNLVAGSNVPPTPRAFEREALEDKDDFRCMSENFIYRHHVATRGLQNVHRSQLL